MEDVEIQLQLAYTEVKDSELIYFIRTHLSDDEGASHLLDSISIFFDTPPQFPSTTLDIEGGLHDVLDSYDTGKDTAVFLGIELDSLSSTTMELQAGDLTVIATSNVDALTRSEKLEKVEYRDTLDYQIQKVSIRNHLEPQNRFYLSRDSARAQTWFNVEDSFPTRFEMLYTAQSDTTRGPFDFIETNTGSASTSVKKTFALLRNKLQNNNLPSTFTVIEMPGQDVKGIQVTYNTGGFGRRNWSIDLQKYQWFILGKMFPTLAFSLILLGIISLAFWTLLKNWTREKRLALVKNEFINNMTHELKTPIATVGVALEAISNFDLQKDEDKTREYLDMSRSEIGRLSLLVDKVLNIAAFDSDKSTINTQNIDIKKIIKENIRAVRLQLQHKGGTLDFKCDLDQAMYQGDELHLSNVVHNLIDNAIKYSKDVPNIEISLRADTRDYILVVEDNGLGIPKEYQSRIFDRFFRVPTNDQHDVKGHGLGLNYVQNVILAHKGTIAVSSVENQGTKFTITLPKEHADA